MKEMPNNTNAFINNRANFANDFYTFPLRLQLFDGLNWINESLYTLDLVPGITNVKLLHFEIVDYYGQTIQSLNGRFYILFYNQNQYFSKSYSILQLKNFDFSDLNDNTTKINGISFASVKNGLNYYSIFINISGLNWRNFWIFKFWNARHISFKFHASNLCWYFPKC